MKERIAESQKIFLLGIMTLGLIFRLVNISSPVLDLYPIRQEYCAMVARNFFRNGLNLLNPQVDWLGNLNPYWSAEFPLVSFMAALLYKIFGIHEYLGRLVAISFSIGSIYLLYKLSNLYFDRKTSLFAAFCFAVMPLNVYFSRTFMPESQMIFFSVATLYLLSLWVKYDKLVFFILSILAASATFLAKISSLYISLPILFLFYTKYRRRLFLNLNIWLFFIIALFPSIFWYSRSNIQMNSYILDFENLKYLLEPIFYKRIAESIIFFILTPLGIMLFILGFFIKIGNKTMYFFHIWLMSVIMYIFAYSKLNYIHYYYQLPLAPVLSIFMGRALSKIDDKEFVKQTILYNIHPKKLVAALLVLFAVSNFIILRPFYRWNKATYEAAKIIRELTPKDSIVIAGRCTQEAPLYYCDRKGWVINEEGDLSYIYNWIHKDISIKSFPRLEEIELIKYLISRGASYYWAANLEAFNSNPRLVKYLRDNFKVFRQTDKYIIFSLK